MKQEKRREESNNCSCRREGGRKAVIETGVEGKKVLIVSAGEKEKAPMIETGEENEGKS